jgi:hypothetical protein
MSALNPGSLLTVAGCPFACGAPAVRCLIGGLNSADTPPDRSYLALDNIKTWMLAFDMDTIPWGRAWYATFSNDTETSPDSQGLGDEGVGFPNSTYVPDPAVPAGSALYGFARVQCLFQVPTNYLMLCVGWNASTGNWGWYDEGCAGSFGGACGVIEVPWSVIPSYPYVWIFLQGPTNTGAQIFPDLITLVDNTYGAPGIRAGPDWNASQTCGSPAHCCDPDGEQFSAP